MNNRAALDRFLAGIQNRAFVNAKIATGNEDEALDIVQDCMLKLVKAYADKPESEWPGLFQRVLQNTIRDWYRRQKVRRVLFWWQQHTEGNDVLDHHIEPNEQLRPETSMQNLQMSQLVQSALQTLPERQQQAFLLRAWWEHSVEETADIMGCTGGSVKTHYSRALKAIRLQLANEEGF